MTKRVENLIKALKERNLTKEEAFALKFAMDDIVYNFCNEETEYDEYKEKQRMQDLMYIDENGEEQLAF